MARPRDPRRDVAKQKWLDSEGDIKLVDLAEQMGVTSSTIRKWKANDKWEDELKGSAPKSKRSTPKPKRSTPKRSRGSPGAPKGNKNAAGNKGGAPLRNDNAVTHGFFRRYLPQKAMSIIEDMDESGLDVLDMLWMSIQTKFAAIMHSQEVMFVESKDEMIKELKRSKVKSSTRKTEKTSTDSSEEEYEYEFQFAWDRQATFLKAQSRAMAELRALIKDFMNLSGQDDYRRLQLAKMEKDIERAKAEIKKISDTSFDLVKDNVDLSNLSDEELEKELKKYGLS